MTWFADIFRWIFYFPFRSLVTRLPRPIFRRIGYLLGDISYFLRRTRARIAKEELRSTFAGYMDNTEIPHAVRTGMRLSIANLLETFCFPKINASNIKRWIRLDGCQYLEDALENQRGVIIVIAHFGANQMIIPALGFRRFQIHQLGSRPEDWNRLSGIQPSPVQKKMFQVRLEMEKHLPAQFIYIDRSMRPVYDCLKKNGILIMAADGRAGNRFLKTRFASRYIQLSSGPFRIAKATGAVLLPAFPVCDYDGVHTLHIQNPILVPESADDSQWAVKAAELFAIRLAIQVLTHPDHYSSLLAEARIRADTDPIPLISDDPS